MELTSPVTRTQGWQAEMQVADPVSFSRQLGDLQTSLQRANTPLVNAHVSKTQEVVSSEVCR